MRLRLRRFSSTGEEGDEGSQGQQLRDHSDGERTLPGGGGAGSDDEDHDDDITVVSLASDEDGTGSAVAVNDAQGGQGPSFLVGWQTNGLPSFSLPNNRIQARHLMLLPAAAAHSLCAALNLEAPRRSAPLSAPNDRAEGVQAALAWPDLSVARRLTRVIREWTGPSLQEGLE